MPKRFAHFIPLSKEVEDKIWNEGLFVPDANILLQIYRLPSAERDNLLKILTADRIRKRIWFPYQVAKEFFKNRRGVITSQNSAGAAAEQALRKAIQDIEKDLEKKVRKSHPYLDRENWVLRLKKCGDELFDELAKARDSWPVALEQDQFVKSLEKLMEGRIGIEPTPEDIKKWVADAFQREKNGENYPGKKDANNKEKAQEPDKGLGDFFIWQEMLRHAKSVNKSVIFVTEDMKDDWWEIYEGKKFGPIPEYRKEWTTLTGTEFLLCGFGRFIDWANEYTRVDLEKSEIVNLRKAVRDTQGSHSRSFKSMASQLAEALRRQASEAHYELSESLQQAFQKEWKAKTYDSKLLDSLREIWGLELENASKSVSYDPVPNPLTPKPVDVHKESIVQWFLENFDSPAHGVPHRSNDGGYQYIFGGPWDAEEEVFSAFPDVDEKILESAINEIEAEGTEWVRKGLY